MHHSNEVDDELRERFLSELKTEPFEKQMQSELERALLREQERLGTPGETMT